MGAGGKALGTQKPSACIESKRIKRPCTNLKSKEFAVPPVPVPFFKNTY